MIITEKDIKQVLAMFDKEDIPYINFKYLNNKYTINNIKHNSKIKVKKIGGRNDKSRK